MNPIDVDILLATYRTPPALLDAQRASIDAQKGVVTNVIVREDSAGEGPAANFSALMSESSAPYAAFSDADDVWLPGKLARLMESMREIESAAAPGTPVMVFCDSTPTDASLRPIPGGTFIARQRVDVAKGLAFPRLLMQNFIAGNLMLFNAALRRKAGAVPPEALMHDAWVTLVAAAFGRIGFVDEPLVLYRQHGANAVGATLSASARQLGRAAEGAGAFCGRLAANIAQARAFVDRFGDEAPSAARALASFPSSGWWARRRAIVRHGLYKQGLCRNAALLAFA